MTGPGPGTPTRLLISLVLAVVALTGCVQVPTSGPIKPVQGEPESCQSCVNVEVAPPAVGDEPRRIVEGYLLATSNYQPGYSVARQFLTRRADDAWAPEKGVKIYDATPVVKGNEVSLVGQLVGELSSQRNFSAKNERLTWNFGLTRQDGEWRIDHPPDGLLVRDFSFTQFYSGYSVYFVGDGGSLVPERRYLPALRTPAVLASALVSTLLSGPSDWLGPAAGSAIPQGTTLSGSVALTNGIAEVGLSDSVLALPDPQRSQLAAQIVYTLRQVSGVKGVLLTVNSQKFRVPEGDPTSLVVAVDAFPSVIDPVPFVADQLYAVRKGRVQLVTGPADSPHLVRATGALGKLPVSSLAVSLNGKDVAVVSDRQTTLSRAETASGAVTPLQAGMTDLLRPQFARSGELWAIGRRAERQQLMVFDGERKIQVDAPALDNPARVTAFRVSPDGARVALVRRTAEGVDQLGLARVIRADKITVDRWLPIDLARPGLAEVRQIADVAWLDANELMLLGAVTKNGALVPVRVAADASQVTAETGEPSDWNALHLSVLTRPQTLVVVGASGQAWRDDGSRWLTYLDNVTALAYPG